MSIQEAAEVEENPYLDRLFGPEILCRLPNTGINLVRKTALGVIGKFSISSKKKFSRNLLSMRRCIRVVVPTHILRAPSQCTKLRRRSPFGTVAVLVCCECIARSMWCESGRACAAYCCVWRVAFAITVYSGEAVKSVILRCYMDFLLREVVGLREDESYSVNIECHSGVASRRWDSTRWG